MTLGKKGWNMARLTKTEAAWQLGIARSTLYKLIDQGALSATPDGMIDSAELVRAAASVDRLRQRTRPSVNTEHMDTQQRGDSLQRHLADSDRKRPQTDVRERLQTSTDDRSRAYVDLLVDTLREQLNNARETIQRERETVQERERAYRDQIERLTLMLHEAQHRYDRLLDAPHPPVAAPVPTPARRPPRRAPQPAAPAGAALEASVPTFDPRKYVLGKLCRRTHDYQGTGQSLLRLPSHVCLECDRERARERRQAKREERR